MYYSRNLNECWKERVSRGKISYWENVVFLQNKNSNTKKWEDVDEHGEVIFYPEVWTVKKYIANFDYHIFLTNLSTSSHRANWKMYTNRFVSNLLIKLLQILIDCSYHMQLFAFTLVVNLSRTEWLQAWMSVTLNWFICGTKMPLNTNC